MSRFLKAETVGEMTALRGNLATLYLSTIDARWAFEAQQEATTAARRERLRAELDAINIVPLTNPADQHW